MRAIDADALIDIFEDRLEKIRNRYGDYSGEVGVCAGALRLIRVQPTIEPEPTRILETRAIPSDDDRVSLSETVTATYYDEEKEEWSRRIVTIRDVLDSVCDEYTVLPSAQPERKKGKWLVTNAYPHNVYCSECNKRFAQTNWAVWEDGSLPRDYCPSCGAKMEK